MKVLLFGSSGLLGQAFIKRLHDDHHEVMRALRKKSGDTVFWDPDQSRLDPTELEGYDAIVNFSGENIATGWWTAAKKKKIVESRVNGTKLLCDALSKVQNPPSVLLNASAIGYYGNRGKEKLNEESLPGTGFFPETCLNWEASTSPAKEAGIRVVNLRIGIVISKKGGALKKMLLPFKLCLGGKVGDGNQYYSWVSIHDLVDAILFCMKNEKLEGPVNIVSPNPVTNSEFTKLLGKVLHRPTIFPLPAFVARLVLGEMADALLLSSSRIQPTQLLSHGFQFRFKDLKSALQQELH